MGARANLKKATNIPTYERPSIIIMIGLLGLAGSLWLSFLASESTLMQTKDELRFYSTLLLGATVLVTSFTGFLSLRAAHKAMDQEKEEFDRVRRALDVTSSNIMIADSQYNIFYLNNALTEMFRSNERDLRRELNQFNLDTLNGTNMDVFHKNPAHQRGMLDKLQSTYKTEIKVAGRVFRLIANPIFDENKNKTGVVVEWLDRTDEALTEEEIENVMTMACDGNLDKRIDVTTKQGFIKNVSDNLNMLLDLVQRMITDVSTVMGALADGNLSKTIDREYKGTFNEVKVNINATIQNLSELILDIRQASAQVNVGTNEIAQGNQDLQQRTESQASALEETAATMEEISSSVKSSSANAKKASEVSAEAKSRAEKGGVVVEQVVQAMSTIKESSSKIVDIIGVIDDIAFQTNLLALNAAVEAARAGEQGKGFAVVAAEVRNLAQRSATSAKEIKELIQDSVHKVDEGTNLAHESGESLNELLTSVNEVNDMITSISSTTEEQASSIIQINEAVANMDNMTQQNSALVEELAAASSQMSDHAMRLANKVEVFQVAKAMLENNVSATASMAMQNPAVNQKPDFSVKKTTSAIKSPLNRNSNDEEDQWVDF